MDATESIASRGGLGPIGRLALTLKLPCTGARPIYRLDPIQPRIQVTLTWEAKNWNASPDAKYIGFHGAAHYREKCASVRLATSCFALSLISIVTANRPENSAPMIWGHRASGHRNPRASDERLKGERPARRQGGTGAHRSCNRCAITNGKQSACRKVCILFEGRDGAAT
jgi:hypothetical protein